MMRIALLAVVLLSITSAPIAAQYAPAPRIAAVKEFNAFELSTRAEFLEARTRELGQREVKAIPGQFFAGFAGLIVGTGLGVATGLMIGMGANNGSDFETAAITATAVGMIGGTTYGVYKFSQAKGGQGSAPATIGGATLGLLGGPLMWVTAPLGARWAYNKSRTDSLAPAP